MNYQRSVHVRIASRSSSFSVLIDYQHTSTHFGSGVVCVSCFPSNSHNSCWGGKLFSYIPWKDSLSGEVGGYPQGMLELSEILILVRSPPQ